jgi:hypothetical protein
MFEVASALAMMIVMAMHAAIVTVFSVQETHIWIFRPENNWTNNKT